jgi:hypothetical protein
MIDLLILYAGATLMSGVFTNFLVNRFNMKKKEEKDVAPKTPNALKRKSTFSYILIPNHYNSPFKGSEGI